MSTRIYCDQCGSETSKRKALRFSLSGYSANRTSMGQLNDIEIDICPDCAQRFNDQTIGTIHIRRDRRHALLGAPQTCTGAPSPSPYCAGSAISNNSAKSPTNKTRTTHEH